MKINKILAAGIAATLAVTSLAAVAVPASAETKTFEMAKTQCERKVADILAAYFRDTSDITTQDTEGTPAVEEVPADVAAEKTALDATYAALVAEEHFVAAITPADPTYVAALKTLKDAADTAKGAYVATDKAKVLAYANAVIALAASADIPNDAADEATAADEDADDLVAKVEADWVDAQAETEGEKGPMVEKPTTLTIKGNKVNDTDWTFDGATLKVTGNKTGTTGSGAIITNVYQFVDPEYDGTWTLDFLIGGINKAGQANLNIFDKITDVDLYINLKHTSFTSDDDEKHKGFDGWHNTPKEYYTLSIVEAAADRDANVAKIYEKLTDRAASVAPAWYNATPDQKDMFAFLEKTTDNGTIDRTAVKLLSSSADYIAGTLYTQGTQTETAPSATQSFDDGHVGTAPFWFGGLSSWVADFFNGQNNGKITFNFTAQAASSSNWKNGGIPSTEVGLKSAVAGTNMGLFVNYNASTGSLQSLGEVDGTSIVFDISQILKDMGGLTKGNVTDIYYGMNKGIEYKNDDYKSVHAATAAGLSDKEKKQAQIAMGGTNYVDNGGIWYKSDASYKDDNKDDVADAWSWSNGHAIGYIVESVTLSYDENATDADTDTKQAADDVDVDDDDDDDDTDVTDDDDDDDDDADDADDDDDDDDDDASLDDDDDDDDDVANAEDINTPADDDANPGTGVALAVIPAIVAAAAAVVSKKRK